MNTFQKTSVTKLSITIVISIVSATALAQADNVVYRCVGDDGVPNYTNAIAGLKGCEPVSGVSVTTIPAFKQQAAPTIPAAVTTPTAPPTATAPARNSTGTSTGNTGPADFPRISADTQRQRDDMGRRPILERELKDREERCNSVRANSNIARGASEEMKAYSERMGTLQSQLDRCDADTAAIKRELSAIR